MGISFYPATATVTPTELVERYGLPPVALGPVDGHTHEDEVHVSNTNAPLILEALGLPLDEDGNHAGDAAADDFLGRVLLAEAMAPQDAGVPMHRLQPGEASSIMGAVAATRGATVYDCGRPTGYLQMRLSELRKMAERCQREGWMIAWA